MMGGYGGAAMMNGMQQPNMMGMHHQKSASYMQGMNGSMMGGSYMGGMGQPGSMNGMMPQKAGSYMGGMGQSNSYMGGMGQSSSYMGGMGQSNSYMGGMGNPMGMTMPQMGGHPGNPYGGMRRSTSLPHSQGNQGHRHHSNSGSGHRSSGGSQSGTQRSRAPSNPAAGMPLAQPQSQGFMQRQAQGRNPYYNAGASPQSLPDNPRSVGAGERKSRSSTSVKQQSSSRSAHTSQERSLSNGHSPSPGDQGHAALASLSPGAMQAQPSMASPPPVYGELLSSIEGSGSFLFDSAGSQQLAAAAAATQPAAPPAKAPQRQYKHLGIRNGRWASPQLEVTPEGDDESTMAGDSQILL